MLRGLHSSTPLPPLALALGLAGCGPVQEARRPNVLLISVDTLRADHVSCYGYGRETTPRIDRLAREGTRFETVVSSTSWTLGAHGAIFTALPDSVHGAFTPEDRLPEERETLAERLQAAGYRTAGFYSGPFLHPAFGLEQGFDEWISCTRFDASGAQDEETVRGTEEFAARLDDSHEDVTSPKLLAEVRAWLARRADERPFFLFVHMWDPHYNYIPPPPYDRRFDPDYDGPQDGRGLWKKRTIQKALPARDLEHVIALYDGEIAFTDEHIGLIADELATRGLLDETLVVVAADHGEEFFEHGAFGHHRTLMDEGLLVPLVLRYPARVPAGRAVASQVRLADVAPTVLELCGLAPFTSAYGSSLVPLLEGPGADRAAFAELHIDQQEALRIPALKAMSARGGGVAESATFVFDLAADPDERRSLPARAPLYQRGARELAEASAHAAALRALLPRDGAAPAHVPPEVLEELRALGYIGDE
jgi:arylsulfatase A-like enzyme